MSKEHIDNIRVATATIATIAKHTLGNSLNDQYLKISYESLASIMGACGSITTNTLALEVSASDIDKPVVQITAARQSQDDLLKLADQQLRNSTVPSQVGQGSNDQLGASTNVTSDVYLVAQEELETADQPSQLDAMYPNRPLDSRPSVEVMVSEGLNLPTEQSMRDAILKARTLNDTMQPQADTPAPRSARNMLRDAELADMALAAAARERDSKAPAMKQAPVVYARGQRPEVAILDEPAVMVAQPTAIVVRPRPTAVAPVVHIATQPLRVAIAPKIEPPRPVQTYDTPIEEVDVKKPLVIPQVLAHKRTDDYIPAVGANRDLVTKAGKLQPLYTIIPPSEMIAGATAQLPYAVIPGSNARLPTPYERLTLAKHSVFSELFAPTAYTPDCRGLVEIDKPLKWHKDLNLDDMIGEELVTQATGYYGYNENIQGPSAVLFRLVNCMVVWNFNHTANNCRIFYIGRSNLTGLWYPPEAMDHLELQQVVFELATYTQRTLAALNGKEFKLTTSLRT